MVYLTCGVLYAVEVLKKASGERCRRLISSAKDYDEMKMFASTPVCNSM
jgi:hypothetical protein